VWAHCASTGQEVNGVVLQPSHICIHIYTYMLTARAVYVVRYPTLSNGLVVHKLTRPSREVECVGLREERGVGLRDWCMLIILPAQVTTYIITIYYYSARKLILILPSHGGWKAEST